jgi:hypothetical protein
MRTGAYATCITTFMQNSRAAFANRKVGRSVPLGLLVAHARSLRGVFHHWQPGTYRAHGRDCTPLSPSTLVEDLGAIATDAGVVVSVRVRGALRADGWWEGFLEIVEDGARFVTPPETRQATFANLRQWALDLSSIYIAGALVRAKDMQAK